MLKNAYHYPINMEKLMPDFLKLAALASIIAFADTAIAQDTTTDGDTTEAATETPPADADTDTAEPVDGATDEGTATEADPLARSMGVEVADENAVGTTYVKDEFGDWDLQCFRVEEGQAEPCQLYQLMKDAEGNGVAEINFISLPEGQQAAAGATIVTPLETLLTQQLTMAIDGGATKRYPFTWCSAAGCFSRIGFSNGDIAAFKRGANAKVTVVPVAAPDQKVTVTLSLTGFTDGYAALEAASKQ